MVVEELREFFHLLLIACLGRLNQHQQWHARLQEQVTDVVHYRSVQLQYTHNLEGDLCNLEVDLLTIMLL